MFGDPGSGAEKVTTVLLPFLAQTAMKSHHKPQPQQETVALSLSISLWLSSGVTGRQSSHPLAPPGKQELDNESVGLLKKKKKEDKTHPCPLTQLTHRPFL